MRAFRIALICLGLVAGGVHAPLFAVDFVVTRYDDPAPTGCLPGDCSLREATLDANSTPGLDRVLLFAGTYELSRFGPDDVGQLGDLDLLDDVEILGLAATMTTIDAGPLGTGAVEQVITVQSGSATLRDLRITGSQVEGIHVFGDLTMERCEVVNNDFQGNDAGILVTGAGSTAVVRDSAIINNGSGLIAATGADVEMENVTLTLNGQNQIVLQNGASLDCRHCTVVNVPGGNPEVLVDASLGIFANSIVSGDCESIAGGIMGSVDGGNVESPGHSCLFFLASDRDDVADPGLSALGDHGGGTRTFDLDPDSIAIDLVVAAECSTHDERGVARGVPPGAPCDSGAVEHITQHVATPIFNDGFESSNKAAWSTTAP